MKIGIDIRNIGKKRTGDETVFFNLVKNLALIDQKNDYSLFTDITEKNILDEIAERLGISGKNNFKIVALKTLNKFSWNFWTLPRHLRKNPLDIYHTQYITPFFVSRRIQIITTIHDVSFNFFPQFIKIADLFFLKTLILTSLKRADKVVAVSEFTRDEIMKYYKVPGEKIGVVQNAIGDNFSEKPSDAEYHEAVKKRYDLPEKFILYLGTMQPRKNLPLLVEAYGKIRTRMPGLKLVLAGGKNAYNFDRNIGKTINKFSLSEDVIFTGYVQEEDKLAFFQLAKVFCSPSFYEGFGIPILEAMSAGTPVIASRIPAHEEIAGDSACFFDSADSDSLAEKIYDVCTKDEFRRQLVERGKEKSKEFSWKKSAEKTLAIYERMGN